MFGALDNAVKSWKAKVEGLTIPRIPLRSQIFRSGTFLSSYTVTLCLTRRLFPSKFGDPPSLTTLAPNIIAGGIAGAVLGLQTPNPLNPKRTYAIRYALIGKPHFRSFSHPFRTFSIFNQANSFLHL